MLICLLSIVFGIFKLVSRLGRLPNEGRENAPHGTDELINMPLILSKMEA